MKPVIGSKWRDHLSFLSLIAWWEGEVYCRIFPRHYRAVQAARDARNTFWSGQPPRPSVSMLTRYRAWRNRPQIDRTDDEIFIVLECVLLGAVLLLAGIIVLLMRAA